MQTALQRLYHLICAVADLVLLAVLDKDIARLTKDELNVILCVNLGTASPETVRISHGRNGVDVKSDLKIATTNA